jgi:hypothetical protein
MHLRAQRLPGRLLGAPYADLGRLARPERLRGDVLYFAAGGRLSLILEISDRCGGDMQFGHACLGGVPSRVRQRVF